MVRYAYYDADNNYRTILKFKNDEEAEDMNKFFAERGVAARVEKIVENPDFYYRILRGIKDEVEFEWEREEINAFEFALKCILGFIK